MRKFYATIYPRRINGRFAKKQVREAAMMALMAA